MQDCGCDKVANIDKLGDDGHPISKNHTHLTLDEFFAQPTQLTQPNVLHVIMNTRKTFYQQGICQGCNTGIDRPPQIA
jgi:hypothetical protein